MTDPNFKPATPNDIETLIAMMRELYAHEGLAFDKAVARRALLGVIGDETFGRVFLILSADEVAGYAALTFGYSLEFHGRDAFVDELYLRDEYRGQGFGKRALRFLTEVCAAEGVNALHLEVERANTSAQAVYRKFGFEDHDRYLMTKYIAPEIP
ncbi:MAG TPA: GNAT family N-acetyltransferase [Blastocatellia bacterium]|nr:GNAT family N-acetyltransferase [Blastocatellia bacterium]